MSFADTILFIFIGVIFFIIFFLLFYRGGRKEVKEVPRDHDNIKKRHPTRRSAELEILRMRGQNLPGSDRLNAYYNERYNSWFVGKSKY